MQMAHFGFFFLFYRHLYDSPESVKLNCFER